MMPGCVCRGRWRRAGTLLVALILGCVAIAQEQSRAGFLRRLCCTDGTAVPVTEGGTYVWQPSPEQEQRRVASNYNHYCVRCHGVDGRGVWDIPRLPDFTNPAWQACHSDDYIANIIYAGKPACMPPFRAALDRHDICALVGYLRTFVPGTEVSRPDFNQP